MTRKNFTQILKNVDHYYTGKIDQYGLTSRGVDWSSTKGQELRFLQLLQLADRGSEKFSLCDFGCGYGAMLDFMVQQSFDFEYLGLDVSQKMIESARLSHAGWSGCHFEVGSCVVSPFDYIIASGIFNVKMEHDSASWFDYVVSMLEHFNEMSRKGFAFNCLTSYSDVHLMRDDLYYANPCKFFDICKQKFSKNVALLHDYGLYEFTVIVRK